MEIYSVRYLAVRLSAVNWRLVLALASVALFALAGSADEGGGF